jgi:peptide/nickel transport system permease protein
LARVAQDLATDPTLGADYSDDEEVKGRTPFQLFWARFKQDKLAFVGAGFIVVLILIAIAAPLVTKFDPNDISHSREQLDDFGLPRGPNSDFLMGADTNGRDVMSRLIYGARTSLRIALVATGISLAIGITLGMIAGYFRGALDTVISRTIDIILSVPLLLFAVGIAATCSTSAEGCDLGPYNLQPGLGLVTIIIAFFSWPYIARIVRGNTLSIREKEFIDASRALGSSHIRVMFRDILPNLVAPIIVYATLIIPANIIFEASLSFLGVGVPHNIPSWGELLDQAADNLENAWWLMAFPASVLFLTVLSFNLLGDGLRDALDPRSNR